MRPQRLLALAVALLCVAVVVGPATAGVGTEAVVPESAQDDELIQDCARAPPEDHSDPAAGNDVVGWVDGYWYDEPLEINATGGLTRSELDQLTARTAARFEAMRCLTAEDGAPPVRVQSRAAFQQRQDRLYDGVDETRQLADDAKFEAMLVVSSEQNSTDAREETRGATIGGQYNFRRGVITMVSDDPNSLLIDEEILVHEIGHAIQDQQFDLFQYERQTLDQSRGVSSLLEGDVTLIETRYLEACERGLWEEPCVSQDFGGESTGGPDGTETEPPNWGLYFSEYQPYSDGPSLVEAAYEEGGWTAVNDLYDDPPQSAYYSAFPGTNEGVELADVSVPDESTDGWERLTFAGRPDYDTIGVAGISGMFTAPTYETDGEFNIYDPQTILNREPDGDPDDLNPLNYNQTETEGWRDDKLYTYRNDANETGVVWKSAWVSAEDARPFVDAYESLVEYRNGVPVSGYEHTYTFGPNSSFDMAVSIVPDGNRVTILTAPTLEALDSVHQGVELVESTPEPTPDEASTDGTETASDDRDAVTTAVSPGPGEDQQGADTDDTDGPGFGVVAAVVALLAGGLFVRQQRARDSE